LRWPLKELQQSVGDDNAGSCGGEGNGVSVGYGLSGGAGCGTQDSGCRGGVCCRTVVSRRLTSAEL